MALQPQKFREIVFQILFSKEFEPEDSLETALMLMDELKVTKRSVLEAHARADAIRQRLPELDEKISQMSHEYQFERISTAEKSALRLGLFEILYDDSLPPKVSIAEAIRLTRKFGTPESANFVNAILDAVYKHGLELAAQPVS